MGSMVVVDRTGSGWIWRLVLSAACLVAGVLALSTRISAPVYDLQMIAPDDVSPGRVLPVRARVLRMKDQSLPQVEAHQATLTMLDAGGKIKLTTVLKRSACDDAEGNVSISRLFPSGDYTLRVSARTRDGTLLQSSKRLRVMPDAKGLLSHPRWAHATQHGRMDETRWHRYERTKTAIDIAVEQGSCLPEFPCVILIHTTLRGVTAKLTNVQGAKDLSEPAVALQGGYAALKVLVQGPMAKVTVLLSRGETPVVGRSLELPVALGQPAFSVVNRRLAGSSQPQMKLSSAQCMIADAFELDGQREHWGRTQARPAHLINSAQWQPTWLPLSPGLWRLQLRASRFDTRSARSAFVSVEDGNLQQRHAAGVTNMQLKLAFENATRESAHVVLPEPARSLPAQQAASRTSRAQLRAAVGVMAALVGISLLITFLLGGMRAQWQADGLSAALGVPRANLQRQHRWFNIVALALLACAAGVGTFLLLWLYLAMP